jgi:Cd2+/Zn2+-exporting ATPase
MPPATIPSPVMEPAGAAAVRSVFVIRGLDCADCATKLEKRVRRLAGVSTATLNFGAAKLTVVHSCPAEAIAAAVEKAGYSVATRPAPTGVRTLLTVASGVLLVLAQLAAAAGGPAGVARTLYLAGMAAGGYYVARAGLAALMARTLDMNFLMTVAAAGAVAIGEWSEGATAVFLFSLGNTLQAHAFDRTRRSIRSLMELAPREAVVRRNGREAAVPVGDIVVGDIVVVRPGERIPMDGVVAAGRSAVDQAPITGESIPVEKAEGSEVFAGTVNGLGALEVRVTRRAAANTIMRIMHLVEEAQARRAPSQQFVDLFARRYTPIVIATAFLLAVVPPLLGQPFVPWLHRSLILLVISCPCALVISTPVAIVSAIGAASRHGVLIKGGAYLELAGSLKVVALDKTGTLTEGRPVVTDVIPLAGDVAPSDVLRLAAAVESRSQHPLAAAILQRARDDGVDQLPLPVAEDAVTTLGRGVRARLDGVEVAVGSPEWAAVDLGGWSSDGAREAREAVGRLEGEGKTVILVAREGKPVGILAVADRVRPGAARAVADLRAAGVCRIVMLTGDNPSTAAAVAAQAGVDEVRASLLPEDKAGAVRELLAEAGGPVAMVGDGVNDAPALATASIGVAMGAAGSAAALETADVALMSDDLGKLAYLIRLGRATVGVIRQNVAFSLAIKGVFLTLTMFGVCTLWMAVFADTGAALIVIANGLRLARAR